MKQAGLAHWQMSNSVQRAFYALLALVGLGRVAH
jgi:hypothetical protein